MEDTLRALQADGPLPSGEETADRQRWWTCCVVRLHAAHYEPAGRGADEDCKGGYCAWACEYRGWHWGG